MKVVSPLAILFLRSFSDGGESPTKSLTKNLLCASFRRRKIKFSAKKRSTKSRSLFFYITYHLLIDNATGAEQDAYYGTNNLDQDAGTTSGMLYTDYSSSYA